ncbi:MAG TPA: hypothetical protein VI756_09140, partial [Blastocatellia bacterium]
MKAFCVSALLTALVVMQVTSCAPGKAHNGPRNEDDAEAVKRLDEMEPTLDVDDNRALQLIKTNDLSDGQMIRETIEQARK